MAENPMLRIADIRRDGGTQAREGIRQAAVNEYTAALRDGETFPPVVVFNDGETLWLADGFHRVAAALNVGLEEIAAEVKEGSIHEAKWYAMGANKGHGERMSNADKRHAVLMALEDEELSKKMDREIAERCKVSHMTVHRIRSESVTMLQNDQSSPKEKASDSKSSEIERLEKELAAREEYEKKWEAEIEATIAERVQEELAKQSGQPNDEPPRDEELERLRQEIAERDESERQLREELAKRPEQPQDEEIERLRRELAGQEEARLEQEERSRRIENEMEALKNGDHPDIEAIVEERVQQAIAEAERPDQNEEIERLRRELAGQEEARLEQEERARRIEDEMDALKNGDHPDIEAIVEERVQKAIAEAGHPDQNGETERRLSEQQERHAEEIRKLHEEMEALRSTGPEIVEKEVPSQELEEALRQKETEQTNLQNQLDAKIREIEEAKNAGMEVSELSGQKDNLVSEIGSLKNDLAETYRENARARFRDAGAGTDAILRATEFFSARLQDADFCKLAARDIVMEIVAFREDMERVRSAADAALEASDQLLFQIRDDGDTDIS